WAAAPLARGGYAFAGAAGARGLRARRERGAPGAVPAPSRGGGVPLPVDAAGWAAALRGPRRPPDGLPRLPVEAERQQPARPGDRGPRHVPRGAARAFRRADAAGEGGHLRRAGRASAVSARGGALEPARANPVRGTGRVRRLDPSALRRHAAAATAAGLAAPGAALRHRVSAVKRRTSG